MATLLDLNLATLPIFTEDKYIEFYFTLDDRITIVFNI